MSLSLVGIFILDITGKTGVSQLVLILIGTGMYDIGIGQLLWTIAGEILEPTYKIAGQQFTMILNFLIQFVFIFIFPILDKFIGSYVFLMFAVLNGLSVVFVKFRGVETRGIPSIETQKVFSQRRSLI